MGNSIDTAPLRLAVADGSFTRAGLDVTPVEIDVAFATDDVQSLLPGA